jgi:hypothetical protein
MVQRNPIKYLMRTPQNHDLFTWYINKVNAYSRYDYLLQITRGNITREGDCIERKLVKMHFGFILLLALGAIIDSHVKLRRANVEV